ncbi:hypothetical protein CVT25_000500 [Psilocybe cyanescens]|uniref:Uncharacterized protein n=1 Tax=Psilocybe cyanescens TaxID=93625 RepID=A0A409XW98_PSICY|nr:hypothetical protein CVT25_000500 [Psilocybe cyanescens]
MLVVFTRAEVEIEYALEVGVLEWCDGYTESGEEWSSQVGGVVEEGFKREELRDSSDGTSDYRLYKPQRPQPALARSS